MYHIKNDKRCIESSNMIYTGLKSLMAKKKFDQIKVTEIAKEAQIGRATFYRSFDAPIDVLRHKSDETFKGLLKHMLDYQQEKPANKGAGYIIQLLSYFDVHSEIIDLLIAADRRDILNDSYAALFTKMYDTYAKSPEFHGISWDYFIAIRTGITINILVQWIKTGKALPPEQAGQLIYQETTRDYTIDSLLRYMG